MRRSEPFPTTAADSLFLERPGAGRPDPVPDASGRHRGDGERGAGPRPERDDRPEDRFDFDPDPIGRLLARTSRAESLAAEPVAGPLPFDGTGETVIVIDDGWNPAYDQSATRIWASRDFAGGGDRDASTLADHGSQVAARVLDAAPGAQIVHLKVFPDTGAGATLFDVEEALAFALRLAGRIDVAAVNMSLGYGNATGPVDSILTDEIAALTGAGTAVTVSAGNLGASFAEGVNRLAAEPGAWGISATTASGGFAGFSQRDPALTDLAAPGERVGVETADGTRIEVSGTSFAAPAVAGIVARLQQAAESLLGGRLEGPALLEILQESGQPLAGEADHPGWREADGDAALAWLVEHAADYADDLLLG